MNKYSSKFRSALTFKLLITMVIDWGYFYLCINRLILLIYWYSLHISNVIELVRVGISELKQAYLISKAHLFFIVRVEHMQLYECYWNKLNLHLFKINNFYIDRTYFYVGIKNDWWEKYKNEILEDFFLIWCDFMWLPIWMIWTSRI